MAISYHVTLVRMTIIKKARNNKHWRGCLSFVDGKVNWCSDFGKQCGDFSQTIKNSTTI